MQEIICTNINNADKNNIRCKLQQLSSWRNDVYCPSVLSRNLVSLLKCAIDINIKFYM